MSGKIVMREEHFAAMIARKRFAGRGDRRRGGRRRLRSIFGRRPDGGGGDGLDRDGLGERSREQRLLRRSLSSCRWYRNRLHREWSQRPRTRFIVGLMPIVEQLHARGVVPGTAAMLFRGRPQLGHVFLERGLERVVIVCCRGNGGGLPVPDVRFHDPGDGKRQRVRRLGTVPFPKATAVRVPVTTNRRHRFHHSVGRRENHLQQNSRVLNIVFCFSMGWSIFFILR